MVKYTIITLMFLLMAQVGNAAEWGCSATSGTFTQSTDCSMTDQVSVAGDLSITGNENTYTTLTAATGKRHFLVYGVGKVLTLRYLKLIDGDSGTENGGTIYVNEGTLYLNSSILYNNQGTYGGAIDNHEGSIYLFDTVITENSASNSGGGIFAWSATVRMTNCTVSYNTCTSGKFMNEHWSSVVIKDSKFLSNQGGNLFYMKHGGSLKVISSIFTSSNGGNIVQGGSNSPKAWLIDIESNIDSLHTPISCAADPSQCADNGFVYSACRDKANQKLGVDCKPQCPIPTSGDVQITSDCILYNQIVVTGSLNVTGIPDINGILPKIMGGGSNRLFKVESGGNLMVQNLNLTGGDVSGMAEGVGKGGAVYLTSSDSLVTLNDSVVCGNRAWRGGGICSYGTLILRNVKMISNTAEKYGGGIYLWGGNMIMVDSTERNSFSLVNDAFVSIFSASAIVESSSFGSEVTLAGNSNQNFKVVDSNLQILATRGDINVYVMDSVIHSELTRETGTGNQLGTPTLYLINVEYLTTSIGSGNVESCTDAPTQCADNGYTPYYSCVDRPNPDEGVICAKICTPGYYQTGIFNHTCEVCFAGKFSTTANQDECTHWRSCDVGERIGTSGTVASDRICKDCLSGTYSLTENSISCTVHTKCNPGQRMETNGIKTMDVVCEDCPNGQFSLSENSKNCTMYTNCTPGEQIKTSGTSASDRICEGCPNGTFSSLKNSISCTAHTKCNSGQRMEANGNKTMDVVCKDCPLVLFAPRDYRRICHTVNRLNYIWIILLILFISVIAIPLCRKRKSKKMTSIIPTFKETKPKRMPSIKDATDNIITKMTSILPQRMATALGKQNTSKTTKLRNAIRKNDLPSLRTQILSLESQEMDEKLKLEFQMAKQVALDKETKLVDALRTELQQETHHIPSFKSLVDAVIAARLPSAFHDMIRCAIDLIRKLEEMEQINHLVLSLNNRTIAEIKSFKNPLPDVENTMRAVFILLGSNVKTWQNIKAEMSHTGRECFKRRISAFDAHKVSKNTIEQAAKLIIGVDGLNIRHKSEGAAVFYKWALNHIDQSYTLMKETARLEASRAPKPCFGFWKQGSKVTTITAYEDSPESNGNLFDSSKDDYVSQGHFSTLHNHLDNEYCIDNTPNKQRIGNDSLHTSM
jgi:hypothetical protein